MISLNLDSLDTIFNLLQICRKYEPKMQSIDAFCGSYWVDACSTLGLLSLIGNRITIKANCCKEELVYKFYEEIKEGVCHDVYKA